LGWYLFYSLAFGDMATPDELIPQAVDAPLREFWAHPCVNELYESPFKNHSHDPDVICRDGHSSIASGMFLAT
jgi:hypothetical protein